MLIVNNVKIYIEKNEIEVVQEVSVITKAEQVTMSMSAIHASHVLDRHACQPGLGKPFMLTRIRSAVHASQV